MPKSLDGVADVPVHGGLSIVGWALSRERIAGVDIALDGRRAAVAYYGIRRPDVAAAYEGWPDCLQSGYAAHVAPRMLTAGRHIVTVTARDRVGDAVSQEFSIDVQDLAEDRGPWALRLKMSQAEVKLQLALLARLDWNPLFRVILRSAIGEEGLARSRRSLESLSRQAYPRWQLCLTAGDARPKSSGQAGRAPAQLIEGFEDSADKVLVLEKEDLAARPAPRKPSIARAPVYIFSIAPGDEFSCDALLEFALATGFDRRADLIYCDERRTSTIDGKVQAFFKPQWSPDLLLSTNYIGRAWCAHPELLRRSGLTLKALAEKADYEVILQLTESAKSIGHTAKLLFKRADECVDREATELQALAAALTRRGIAADVQRGCRVHYYRVQRKILQRRLVSVIVPTCAAGGLIRTCVESLRDRTAYRELEIVCIENISNDRRQWKSWLGKNIDTVIGTTEAFNWSRFNNRAAARARGKYLLFLNDDTEVIEPDWLDALLEHVQRPEVGVVGPQLLYPDRTVQHAGVTLDAAGRGRHVFRHQQQNDPGYFGLALTQRNVIGVTGACLLTRRETFDKLGRFNEAHAVVNGDLDFCLRSWRSGLRNIYTPYARLIHHELASRSQMKDQYDARVFHAHWAESIAAGDPYFNPNLSIDHDQVVIEREPVEEVYAGAPIFDANLVRRILVVKLDHIGDCITALPAVRRLKRAFPAARITVLVGRAAVPIWKAEPGVDAIVQFDFFHTRSGLGTIQVTDEDMIGLGKTLGKMRFDLAIDLRKQPDTRHVLQVSGARIQAGFDHQGRFPWLDIALEWDEDVPLRSKRAHVTEDLNVLVDLVVSSSEAQSASATPTKAALRVGDFKASRMFAKPLVCVHPAAGSEMRQWPLEKFSELINELLARGNIHVAIIGGADDRELVQRMLSRIVRRRQVFDLVGKVSLADLPQLLARAVLFVGNNSGPQHMAASLGIPTVAVHSGVVDAHEWGPRGPRAVAIRRQMSCSPCYIEHAKDCPRALECLTGINSRDVLSTCVRMLALKPPRGSTRGEWSAGA